MNLTSCMSADKSADASENALCIIIHSIIALHIKEPKLADMGEGAVL